MYNFDFVFQYDDLECLGFKGFAVAFREEYAQVIGTSGTVESFTPAVHEYLHALITVGMYYLPLNIFILHAVRHCTYPHSPEFDHSSNSYYAQLILHHCNYQPPPLQHLSCHL